tara:strand:- start:4820 stop:4999 length:180 start_codon:yes stop_codon:yes gene_type:complete
LFLYSYFVAMISSLLAMAWLINNLPWWKKPYGRLLIPVVTGFIWMSYLSYELPPAFMIL